jgi:nucleotide-binding universal stress UspA family protein
MLKRILVGLGGTEYTEAAISHAVDVATRHRASVTGVTLVNVRDLERAGLPPTVAACQGHALGEHQITVSHERLVHAIEDFARACEAAGVSHQVLREYTVLEKR